MKRTAFLIPVLMLFAAPWLSAQSLSLGTGASLNFESEMAGPQIHAFYEFAKPVRISASFTHHLEQHFAFSCIYPVYQRRWYMDTRVAYVFSIKEHGGIYPMAGVSMSHRYTRSEKPGEVYTDPRRTYMGVNAGAGGEYHRNRWRVFADAFYYYNVYWHIDSGTYVQLGVSYQLFTSNP